MPGHAEKTLSVHPITVVNRHHPGATGDYVGRGTALGNIFGLVEGESLEIILDRYRWWLAGELATPTSPASVEIARLAVIAQTAPVNVMCSCAPRSCHADSVREAIYANFGLEAPARHRSTPPRAAQMALFAAEPVHTEHQAFTDLFARLKDLDSATPALTTLVRYQKFLAHENLPASDAFGNLTPEAQDSATVTRFASTLAPSRPRRA